MTIRVLLVEDEGLIRMMTREALEDGGFEVEEAWDGDEAVRVLGSGSSFDIVVTDVRMPGSRDGIGVAAHARRMHPSIPLIVVSGYAPHLMERLAPFNPVAVYISKPYDLSDVVAGIKRLTGTS